MSSEETAGNIKLPYPVIIQRNTSADDNELFFADGCELFMDEHGHQWVKFVAKNGYQKGSEHMMRTDVAGFMIIRNDTRA